MGRSGWGRAAWMVVVALSLVLMHGFSLSHTSPAESMVPTTIAAEAISSGPVTAGAHGATDGLAMTRSEHQRPEPGHAEAFAQTCLAVLTALVLACASFLLTTRPWNGPRELAPRPPRRPEPLMWWVHPRAHLLCVMRT